MISEKEISETICELYKKAVISLPNDVKKLLKDSFKVENDDLPLLNIGSILKNIEIAEEKGIPMCQDTGLPVIFVKLGKVEVENLYDGIRKGIEIATKEIPLRPNVVDPITRENSGNNTGNQIPYIDVELTDNDHVEFTVLPKGFGSENNNALKMALPGVGVEGIKDFVLQTIKHAKGKPCPPMIVGVGVGGNSDLAMKLSKKVLLNNLNERNSDKTLDNLEKKILNEANKTNIGPMGLGGKTTVLAVKILKADTHTAGLPIGVTIQCWAHRHASKKLFDD
jgi:fumarate hydratase subunit alpha